MAVTLPFTLLLLDYWPLGRVPFRGFTSGAPVGRAVLEKIPLLGLSAASSVVTLLAQHKGGAVVPQEVFPLWSRLANAPVAYISYVWKMIWPSGLAVPYPHPGNEWIAWHAILAASLLAIASLFSIRIARRLPHTPVGLFWFLGTLVPVIGLVQVGGQALADRYTYVPMLGLFVIISWSAAKLPAWGKKTSSLAALALLALIALGARTRDQLGLWKDSVTLFSHAIHATRNNAVAHYCLGNALFGLGDLHGAEDQYREALKIQPTSAEAHNELGSVLSQQGRYEAALPHFREALRTNPRMFLALNNMGIALKRLNRPVEALDAYRRALQVERDSPGIHYNIGLVLFGQGRMEEAAASFHEAIARAPRYGEAYNYRGKALRAIGRLQEAAMDFRKALEINPSSGEVLNNYGSVLLAQGHAAEATEVLARAIRLSPTLTDAHLNLGMSLERLGRSDDAKGHYRRALDISPNDPRAQQLLESLLSRTGPS
jgi:Tfp pilus assembly protein PilF